MAAVTSKGMLVAAMLRGLVRFGFRLNVAVNSSPLPAEETKRPLKLPTPEASARDFPLNAPGLPETLTVPLMAVAGLPHSVTVTTGAFATVNAEPCSTLARGSVGPQGDCER